MTDFDVGIIGLGAMGSASAHALAQRGTRVVAFEQFEPPHTMGSSHGKTRIIREAYYEHPLYVPLVRRAYELWRQLETEVNTSLLVSTGGLMVGPESGSLVRGAQVSARTHEIPHEMLDSTALAERFPSYRARKDWVALLEHRAGLLHPEWCINAFVMGAAKRDAEIRLNDRVRRWTSSARGITLETMSGPCTVGRLVVAAGPWLPSLIDSLGVVLPLEIERQLSHWFEPSGDRERFAAERCPVGLWELSEGEVFATLPDEGEGVKCGAHHDGTTTSPDSVDRKVSEAENAAARAQLEQVMPGAGGRLLDSRVCLYTNTPDRHFIIDWLDGGRVLVVSPCSGHGFKFASAIGEIVAQLTLEGRAWIDLAPFSMQRFQ